MGGDGTGMRLGRGRRLSLDSLCCGDGDGARAGEMDRRGRGLTVETSREWRVLGATPSLGLSLVIVECFRRPKRRFTQGEGKRLLC
jgi:hypothetical protein